MSLFTYLLISSHNNAFQDSLFARKEISADWLEPTGGRQRTLKGKDSHVIQGETNTLPITVGSWPRTPPVRYPIPGFCQLLQTNLRVMYRAPWKKKACCRMIFWQDKCQNGSRSNAVTAPIGEIKHGEHKSTTCTLPSILNIVLAKRGLSYCFLYFLSHFLYTRHETSSFTGADQNDLQCFHAINAVHRPHDQSTVWLCTIGLLVIKKF